MAKFFLEWAYNVCICFAPVYFLFDMLFIYGYAKLCKYEKDVYKPYLIGSIILTAILAINCIAIFMLEGLL